MQFIGEFLVGILAQLYLFTGNLGWAILAFTALVRLLLLPLSFSSMKSQKKIQSIQPELKKLKAAHKGTAQELQLAQMELYKKYNINPLAGCLPQVVQLVLLIILYQVLVKFLHQTDIHGVAINTQFYWLNLSLPDTTYVLPILAGVTQLILSVMILPGGEVKDIVPNTSKSKKVQEENKKEEDVADMAASMQKQMLFVMPIMTGFLALRFPSGLALYWVATTVFSIVQQYFVSGLGGLQEYSKMLMSKLEGK